MLNESLKGDEESQKLLLIALRNVAEAQGGVGLLAKKANVGRESLYKALSGAATLNEVLWFHYAWLWD